MKKITLPILVFFIHCAFFVQAENLSALKHYERGQEFEAEENWYSASEEFQLALQENPSFVFLIAILTDCLLSLYI